MLPEEITCKASRSSRVLLVCYWRWNQDEVRVSYGIGGGRGGGEDTAYRGERKERLYERERGRQRSLGGKCDEFEFQAASSFVLCFLL